MGVIVNPIHFHFHPFAFDSLTNGVNAAAAVSFHFVISLESAHLSSKADHWVQGNRLHESNMLIIPFIFIIIFICVWGLFIFWVMNMHLYYVIPLDISPPSEETLL